MVVHLNGVAPHLGATRDEQLYGGSRVTSRECFEVTSPFPVTPGSELKVAG
jgi:hypothetical protein